MVVEESSKLNVKMMLSPKSSMNVVVVGGSLGGLFTGVVLKRLGHNVRIMERNPSALLQTQGAGIVAQGDVQTFFEKNDLTQTPIAVTSRLRHYLDKEGTEIHYEGKQQKMTSWDLLYNLLRANFDGAESAYCKVPPRQQGDGKAVYEYGHTVTGIRKNALGSVEVTFHTREGGKNTVCADLTIAADGASSQVRSHFDQETRRKYAGYVAWRGTVPETEVSPAAGEAFVEKFTFFHAEAIQVLAYVIPGPNGTIKPGTRLINWVWYCNYPADSEDFKYLMTDKDGKLNRMTLHAGKMRDEVWEKQKQYAVKTLPPQFAELVEKTREPFVQAITDVISPRNSYLEGKVLLIGDALAGFRPHTAASTAQAAFNAMSLGSMLSGEISQEEWQRSTMEYAQSMQRHGVQMGDRSQFGNHPLAR